MGHIARSRGFLLGGAKILRSLKFSAEENRLSDPAGKSPDEGTKRADRLEVRGSDPAGGTEHKARQTRGASFVYLMNSGGGTALNGNEVWTAVEQLSGQAG